MEDGLYKVEIRPLPPTTPGEPDWSIFPSIGTIIVSSNPTSGINIAPNLEAEGPDGDETQDTFVVYGPLDPDEDIDRVEVTVNGETSKANLSGTTWTLDVKIPELKYYKITAVRFVWVEKTVTGSDGKPKTIKVLVEKNISGKLFFLKYIVMPWDTLGTIAEQFRGDYDKLQQIAKDNGIQPGVNGKTDEYALSEYWRLLIHDPITDEPRITPELTLLLEELMSLGYKLIHCQLTGGDPVNLATGNFTHKHTDLEVNGAFPIDFVRFYNSRDSYVGRLGMNWHHNFEHRLLIHRNGEVEAVFADGHREHYTLEEGTTSYKSPEGVYNKLESHSNDTYTLTTPDNTVYTFNRAGILVKITDPNGNDTELTYDKLKLVEIRTESGCLTLEYNQAGNITGISDQSGRSVEYDYDSNLNLTSFTGPEGETITYEYDDKFHLTRIRSPRGDGSYINKYDEKGRVVEQKDPRGGVSFFDYDDSGRTTTLTDQMEHTTVYHYDDKYRMVKSVDALGQEENYTYDDDYNVTSHTDKKGYNYGYQYDGRGNVTLITDPAGRTTSFEYNTLNKPVAMTLPDGKLHSYEYDDAGNLIKTTDPLGRVTEISYDQRGLVQSITVPDGTVTAFEYDVAGNLREMVDALNNATSFDYDAANRVKQVTEPEGNVTAIGYDGNNMTTRVTNAWSNIKTYTYDGNGKIKTITDEEGYVTTYYYNGADQIVKIADPLNNASRYEYNKCGNVTAFIDANGNRTEYGYDELNRLTTVTDPEGNTTSYEYDPNDNLVRETNPRGAVTEYGYDELNRLVSVKDPLGNTTSYAYDIMGRVTEITDPLGYTKKFAYDDAGRVVSVTDELGNTEEYSYDQMDRVVTHTRANGAVWQMEYDPAGNLTGMVDPEGNRRSWSYDGNRRVTEAVDPLGNSTSYEYDPLGQIKSITDALGHSRGFVYTPRGQVASATDPNGNTTSYRYDPLRHLTEVIDALGNNTEYQYDAVGNLTAVHQYRAITPEVLAAIETDAATVTVAVYGSQAEGDSNGDTVNDAVYGLDAGEESGIQENQEITESDTGIENNTENESVTGCVYGPADCLDGETIHQPTYYRYDSRNMLVAVEDALGHVTGYHYDPAGNLVEINDREGFSTALDYDLNNQLTGIHYDDGRQVSLNYNPQGYVTGMTDWLGTNTFELDPLGRIKKVTDFVGRVQQFTWTATGQKESVIYPDDSKVTYAYDQLDRLTGVTDAFNRTTSYSYNPAGKLVETLLPNGSKTMRDYDDIYRITSLTHRDPGGKITDSYGYEYDPAGNKTSIKKGITDEDELEENEEKTFSYDALNQLISLSEINGDTRNYYYDTLGNRVAMIEQEQNKKEAKYYQYDQLNRLVKSFDYDGDVKDLSYDNRGNLTEIRSGDKVFNTYRFDAANKLVEAINKFGDSTAYTYDGFGNRIQTVIDLNHGAEHNNRPEFPPGPGGPPEFVQELKDKNPGPPSHAGNPKPGWDHQFNRHYMIQHNVVDFTAQYDNLLMSYGEHSQIQRYTYGLDLVSMDFIGLDDHDNGWIPSGTETAYVDQWDTLYYLHDDLGTVNKVIGSSGKTSAHYNYDEFGRPLGAVKLDPNWSGPDNAISYTGYTYDHFAELYYAQARYYMPGVGRFISEDPWAGDLTQPQTLNPYPYVLNNPLKYIDPLGLAASWAEDCPLKDYQVGLGSGIGPDNYIMLAYNGTLAPPLTEGLSVPQVKTPSLGALGRLGAIGVFLQILLGNPTAAGETPVEMDISATDEYGRNKNTLIYRKGNYTNMNLTPRPGKDTEGYHRGLSFSLTPPLGGNYLVTTMETVNRTEVLVAVKDGYNHVSVRPRKQYELEEWANTRKMLEDNPEATNHIYTYLMKAITVPVRR